jgi:hypothetical protein
MGNPTTTAKAQELARDWAASRLERAELLAWVRRETDGYDAGAAVGRLVGLLGWIPSGPSYDGALELLQAARASR